MHWGNLVHDIFAVFAAICQPAVGGRRRRALSCLSVFLSVLHSIVTLVRYSHRMLVFNSQYNIILLIFATLPLYVRAKKTRKMQKSAAAAPHWQNQGKRKGREGMDHLIKRGRGTNEQQDEDYLYIVYL